MRPINKGPYGIGDMVVQYDKGSGRVWTDITYRVEGFCRSEHNRELRVKLSRDGYPLAAEGYVASWFRKAEQ